MAPAVTVGRLDLLDRRYRWTETTIPMSASSDGSVLHRAPCDPGQPTH